ncbi:MAG: hypothetical protein AB7F99_17525 [Vicinamibacterales bacterium]
MNQIATIEAPLPPPRIDLRASERQALVLPARLTWKDQRGATRFASVVTRDVSDFGVYVECLSAVSIPLFRLVQFQLEREVRDADRVPPALKQGGRILSAVYRIKPATRSGGRQCLALRLMVDPRRRTADRGLAQATA